MCTTHQRWFAGAFVTLYVYSIWTDNPVSHSQDAGEQPAQAFCSSQVLAADYNRRIGNDQLGLVGGTDENTARGCDSNSNENEDSFFTSVFQDCATVDEGGECGYTGIAFVPDTAHTRQVMKLVDQMIRPSLSFDSADANITYNGFDNVSILDTLTSSTEPKYLAAFVFDQLDPDGSSAGLWVDQSTSPCAAVGALCAPRIHTQVRFPENFQAFGESDYEGWQTDRTFNEWDDAGPNTFGPYTNGVHV